MSCPQCGGKTRLGVIRKQHGKKWLRDGYQYYCQDEGCDWRSSKTDFPPNKKDLRLNEINLRRP